MGRVSTSPHVEAVRREFCKVFAKPMGLGELDELFPFEYLQRTGAGSRSLCQNLLNRVGDR